MSKMILAALILALPACVNPGAADWNGVARGAAMAAPPPVYMPAPAPALYSPPPPAMVYCHRWGRQGVLCQ